MTCTNGTTFTGTEVGSDQDLMFDNPNLRQNDSNVLKYIRQNHLRPPSIKKLNLEKPKGNPSEKWIEIQQLFGLKRNGFFIECGAHDGESLSNTLVLERDFGWTGLLVEANQVLLPKLYSKNRRAWISDACLSYKPYPLKVRFIHNTATEHYWQNAIGIIEPSGSDNPETRQFKERRNEYKYAGDAECFPLFSILSAINVTTIDYFSLDVEGLEYKILKTIPFDSVTIKVMSVESHLIPEGKEALLKFMRSKGYRMVVSGGIDLFFILDKFLKPLSRKLINRFERLHIGYEWNQIFASL